MDDTSICLPHDDLHWYLTELQRLGPNDGLHLSLPKTSILTTSSGSSILGTDSDHVAGIQTGSHQHCLSGPAMGSLQAALALLASPHRRGPPEITAGARLLGLPIGSDTFCSNYLSTHLQHHTQRDTTISSTVPDLQEIRQFLPLSLTFKQLPSFSACARSLPSYISSPRPCGSSNPFCPMVLIELLPPLLLMHAPRSISLLSNVWHIHLCPYLS
jgi:hypothetical protein